MRKRWKNKSRLTQILYVAAFLLSAIGINTISGALSSRPAYADGCPPNSQKSTYSAQQMCIGNVLAPSPNAGTYTEFVIKFPNPTDAQITFKNSAGNSSNSPSSFQKVDPSTYVIAPDAAGFGYLTNCNGGPFAASPNVTVHIAAGTQTEDIVANPCEAVAQGSYTIIKNSQNITPAGAAETGVCSTGDGPGGAVGVLLCPAMQLVVDGTSLIQKTFIEPYLTVSPLDTVDHATGKPSVAYTLWKSFRDLANVVLVIAFFAVIFSQATSIGVSNYGIKKILPRLALVAIGANLSYFIVAFIVDAFNIFGAGVSSLVLGVVNAGAPAGTPAQGPSTAGYIFTLATAGLLIKALKAGPFLKALAPIAGFIFLVIIVTVAVLIIRQMLILLLVIIAPLAIVAYLLPNTEQYYKKWNKLLLELLIMYPMIVLLFAAGKIMGTLLANNLQLG